LVSTAVKTKRWNGQLLLLVKGKFLLHDAVVLPTFGTSQKLLRNFR
jgi:hypothetical protein